MQQKFENLLPYEGLVNYHGRIYTSSEANALFERLIDRISWKHDELIMFGTKIRTSRKVAWYGDRRFDYMYSGITRTALPWINLLLEIRNKIEHLSHETFNSCLLNLYHSGAEGMGWHSDDEKELKKNAAIASVSFGSARKFSFKHKRTKEKVDIILDCGSLLVMKGPTQTHWLHQLPKTKKVFEPRINLTFRTML